jgi:hypothetical protein
MKRSTETTRFLNHIEREQNKISTELTRKITIEHAARIAAERELESMRAKNTALNTALSSTTLTAEKCKKHCQCGKKIKKERRR